MTYKDAITIFQDSLENECFARGVKGKVFTNRQVMFYLSKEQQYLNNIYHICDKTSTIRLTSGASEYTIGTNSLPADVLEFLYVNCNGSDIYKISKEEMNTITKASGLPTQYTFYKSGTNRIFEIDTEPDKSYADDSTYALTLSYTGRLDLFQTDNSANSFSNYDETASGYGGSFPIPEEWTGILNELALSNIFRDLRQNAELQGRELNMNKPVTLNKDKPYFIGI